MKRKAIGIIVLSALLCGQALAIDKTATGALLGATAGAVAGKNVKSAVVGAGAAAVTGKSVLKGAALGAGAGGVIGEATH